MKKYTVSEALDVLAAATEVVDASEAGPGAAYVRMFKNAQERHARRALEQAATLADAAERLYQRLRAGGRSLDSEALSVSRVALDLARSLDRVEALREVEAVTTIPED